ncbi:hypothetical protein LCGC14_1921260, partial [marine sediment metagenome]
CVPLGEQPPEGFEFVGIACSEACFMDGKAIVMAFTCEIPLQYQIGQVIGVRETWGYAYNKDCTYWLYVYKIDYENGKDEKDEKAYPIFTKWYSPATIPSDAIRTQVKVIGNSVKEVQRVSGVEAVEIIGNLGLADYELLHEGGYHKVRMAFKDWFNTKYAKPRPRRKNGEIIGYKCWAWDGYSWEEISSNDPHYEFSDANWYYKDKLIEIHPDPFVELPILELEMK